MIERKQREDKDCPIPGIKKFVNIENPLSLSIV